MQYYTGLFAFTQYADISEGSTGMGSVADRYIREMDKYMAESNNSVLGDIEIKDTTVIPTGDVVKCATHKRAYVDMLLNHQFTELKDLYDIAIRNFDILYQIFKIVTDYGIINDREILRFLNNEFKSYFRSYLMSVKGCDEYLKECNL